MFSFACFARLSFGGSSISIPSNASLLQVSLTSTYSELQTLPSSSRSVLGSEAASWQDREFHLVPHHKTGTVMTHQAAENMLRAAFSASSAPLPNGVVEDDVIEATYSDILEDIVSP